MTTGATSEKDQKETDVRHQTPTARPASARGRPATSARGARPADRGGAGHPAPRPPARVRARRWLRDLGPVRRVLLPLAVLAAVVAVVVLVVSLTRGTGEDPAGGGFAVDPARVAELEAAEAERAAENLDAASDYALDAAEQLVPVMHELHAALPVDGSAPVEPTPAELAEWHAVVDAVAADAEAMPTGSSEHNIVRNGFRGAVALLGDTIDSLELAGSNAADGDTATAERLRELAASLRTRAVDSWAIAATQLDMLNIAADRGHLHVFLPVHPEDSLEGEVGLGHGEQGHGDEDSQDPAHDH